ncbi:MAG: ABC transporter ATP-binding protein [Lachnospiraceae bacterium]|nr:ABC transporter ATP-binding protein [Lachnospiraceae bacterium]
MKRQKNQTAAPISTMGRVLRLMVGNYKFSFLMVVICILVGAVATMRGMLFVQSLVDDYIVPLLGQEKPDFSLLAKAISGILIFYLIGIAAAYGYNRIMVTISQGTMRRLRLDLFGKMESLPIRYFDTHAHGDVMSVYTNDVDTLRQLLSQSIPQIINSAATLVATFISLVVLSVPLTVITVAMAGVMLLVTTRLTGLSGKYFQLQQKNLGAVNGYIEEMLDGQRVVKVFCHEEEAVADFKKINEALRDSADKANCYSLLLMPINANIGNLSYVLCAVIGALLALHGAAGMTIGTIIAFLGLNKNFTQPITQISQQSNSVVMAMAGAQRVFDLLDEPAEEDNGYVELVNARENGDGSLEETAERTGIWAWKHPHSDGSLTFTRLQGEVVMDDVDFGYDETKMVLHNIKLYAEPGQKLAFVGTTGAGKTTITNLINRFYDIQDGKIRYDGININKIKKPDLRRSLGVVLQETNLFTGTVMDNIRYGKLDATDEECIAAAKLANADSFIRRLPDGYQTMLTGNGSSLSQGQRQLIAIARAAVADPPVLILDEATSSIDTRTEKLVQDGMDALMKGRTTFVIAHRLSTIQNADCIMVMDQGRIIERGSHDELIAKKGRYYQLYTGKAA